jgi:hypothetical protein|tara:strand:+ start:246 stop:473 length:228 start_codon:yes stop_codon:yes gene_type:complete
MVEDLFKCIDKMISINQCKENNELWVSKDIQKELSDLKEYKGYRIKSSFLMPDNYMVIGKMFCTEEEFYKKGLWK